MKKKLTMCLSVALIAVMVICGTLAYLTSTDSDVNTMTLGNVKINQHEYQRNDKVAHNVTASKEDETLVPFEQGQALYPAVPANGATTDYSAEQNDLFKWGDYVSAEGAGNGLWNDNNLKNHMDKMVFVENTGKSDAYYRTIIAFECPEGMEYSQSPDKEFMMNVNGHNLFDWENVGYTTIDGTRYLLMVATYENALAPGETSRPSLLQVVMTHNATNEDMELLGDTYEILVFSQAVQTEGFANAKTALDTAFGEITTENHPWLDTTIVNVSDSKELVEAIENAENPTTITLENGEYTTNFEVAGGKDITIVGSKYAVLSGQIASTSSTEGTLTLKGVTVKVDNSIKDSTDISQTAKSAIALWGNQTVVCDGVTFDMSLKDSTAITSWWDTGVGTSIVVRDCIFNCNGQRPIRATGNVTVENTVFNDPYRYAVQLTAKASTATEMDKAIINFNNNTIVNGENGKDLVYGIQLEGETYGCHDCVINGAGNTIKDGGTESFMYYCECGKVVHETITFNTEVEPKHEK